MERISIEAFRAELGKATDKAATGAATQRDAEATRLRARLECTKSGIAFLAGAAMLDARFEDFPSILDLSSPNGYNSGVTAEREDGVWRLCGTLETLRKVSIYSMGSGQMSSLAGPAIRAMDIPHSPEAAGRIMNMLKWQSGDEAVLSRVAGSVPAHVMSAMAGLGSDVYGMFSVQARDRNAFSVEMYGAIAREAIDLDAAPTDRTFPPLLALAAKGDDDAIQFALSHGFLNVNVSSGRYTAAVAAVETGRLGTLRTLSRRGERLDVVDDEGNTLLHVAGRLVSEHPGEAPELARFLLGQGLDPAAVNARGQTPVEVASEMASDEDAAERTEDARDRFEEAIVPFTGSALSR